MISLLLCFVPLWGMVPLTQGQNVLSMGDELVIGFNDQVQMEYEAFYIYEYLAVHFSRPDVGLMGFAKFFKESADEEMKHARKFSELINKRGEKVNLQHIMLTVDNIPHTKEGILRAINLAIEREEKVTEKIQQLHKLASRFQDANAQDFLDDFLEEQVDSIAELVVMRSRLLLDSSAIFLLDQELRDKA